jgi:hypothetical protein
MSILSKIYLALIVVFLFVSCSKPAEENEATGDDVTYILPQVHSDNVNPLKNDFLQEEFTDLTGDDVRISDYLGLPLLIAVHVSFKTDDGQDALLAIEALHRVWEGKFNAVILPMEKPDVIRQAIKSEKNYIHFLFRKENQNNLSLTEKYRDLFWDEDLIQQDYPDDSASRHHVSPFYWVIDVDGTIREKLIDYSDERSVDASEVAMVLEELLKETEAGESG